MGNWRSKIEQPPPPMVLVPPLFDFPPMEARSRMLQSSYDLLFGKLARSVLFGNYFEESGRIVSNIMLRPVDDHSVDFCATFHAPFRDHAESGGKGEAVFREAVFRWQPLLKDADTFMELRVSGLENALLLRSCSFDPKSGLGAFTILPVLKKHRSNVEDFGIMGFRYGSNNLSIGMTMSPFRWADFPTNMWMVGKIGPVSAGFQYRPSGELHIESIYDSRNWSFAIDYGMGQRGALYPSFNFSLEYCNNSEVIASFYQHMVVQRKVRNPFEESSIDGVTNYIDLGFEFHSRLNSNVSSSLHGDSNIQVAASWQPNKNILLKAKIGTVASSVAVAVKSWWQPSVAFNMSFLKNHSSGEIKSGFGVHVDNLQKASYEIADPNYVMLVPTKVQIVEDVLAKQRPPIDGSEGSKTSQHSLHFKNKDIL